VQVEAASGTTKIKHIVLKVKKWCQACYVQAVCNDKDAWWTNRKWPASGRALRAEESAFNNIQINNYGGSGFV
jgi:hypothetical protein